MEQNSGTTMIRRYLEEGLVALLPDYQGEEGGTQVFTLQGAHQESRSLPWLVEVLTRFYRLDPAAVRRQTGRLLELRHHIPLPLTEGLVLLPVKVRQAAVLGEHTVGYVNLSYVERVEAVDAVGKRAGKGNGEGCGAKDTLAEMERDDSNVAVSSVTGQIFFTTVGPALSRCRIICRGSLVIHCLNTAATVRAKLHQGELVLQELLKRHKLTALTGAKFTGLDGEALRELLPDCDCLLRNIVLLLLEKASRPDMPELEPERREPAVATGAGKE